MEVLLAILVLGVVILLGFRDLKRNVVASLYALRKAPLSFGSTRRGRVGELAVISELDRLSQGPGYWEQLDDLILPTPDGSTQIDHVLVSVFGIFVIETKFRTGWIFGDARSRNWTQIVYGQKYRFQNPIHQNYKHVVAVRDYLGLPQHMIHSIVTFTGNCEFRTSLPLNVVGIEDLVHHIRSHNQQLLDTEEAAFLWHRLNASADDPDVADLNHDEHLLENVSNPRCPRCGRNMVVRTARKGANPGDQFWGCSGFPNCRATRQIR